MLNNPENKASKVKSKDASLPAILGYKPQSLVSIEYVESLDDWNTAWDHIHVEGFLEDLVAIMDLFSRNVLSWKLSNSLDTQFCMDALEMALASGSRPGIFHSDQGCQFTSADFVGRLQAEDIKISWSGRGRC